MPTSSIGARDRRILEYAVSCISFNDLPRQRPVAVILRHAERHAVTSMETSRTVLLSDQGHADAYELGQTLAALSPVKIYHSPVRRCEQTAEGIARGINDRNGRCELPGPISELSEHGHLITADWDRLGAIVREHTPGLLPREWFMPLKEAAYFQLRILRNQLEENSASTINVSHDWNIMAMREYFFGFRHEDIGGLGYLDGLTAYLEAGKLYLCYREHRHPMD